METKIRHNVFETNSSSTHSICIAKNATLDIPENLHFSIGQFGWECDTLRSMGEKASYLFQGLADNSMIEEFEKIVNILEESNINISYDDFSSRSGYIDHSDGLSDFLDDVSNDKDKLFNYLFSDLSFIVTGNDNDEEDVSIDVSYEHDYYYKGN